LTGPNGSPDPGRFTIRLDAHRRSLPNLKREEAARFSFLLGLPAIAGAGGKEVWELHKAHLDAHGWSILGFGLVIASLSAFAAIWGLLRILERFSAWPFAVYRGVMGVVLLACVFFGWLPN